MPPVAAAPSPSSIPPAAAASLPLGGVDGDAAPASPSATIDDDERRVAPAVAWGEPEACLHYFAEEGVQAIANRMDHQNKKTRLNDKLSLWGGLTEGTSAVEDISLTGEEFKIPPHVVATETWNGALTNALNFGMMPSEDQAVERVSFHVAENSSKRKWASMISKLHRHRPPSPLAGGRPVTDDAPPPPVRERRGPPSRSSIQPVLAAATARASDPAAIDRGRRASGYDIQQGVVTESRDVVVEHRGRASEPDDRSQLIAEMETSKSSSRRMHVIPTSIGAQNDSNGKRFARSAMLKVAQAVGGIHFAAGEDRTSTLPPMHSMVLVILDEVAPQTNDHGGRLKHVRADKPKLTIIAHSNAVCEHILCVVAEQYNNGPAADKPPCINHKIVKTQGSTLLENVQSHIASESPQTQPTRNSETNADVQDTVTPVVPGRAVIRPAYSTLQRTPATADEKNSPDSMDSNGERGEGIIVSQSQNEY